LTLAARAGANDLDRLYVSRGQAERSCDRAIPSPSTHARVITAEEQAFRDCVVAAHGTNPWRGPFWASLAIALPALVGTGRAVPAGRDRRREEASAPG